MIWNLWDELWDSAQWFTDALIVDMVFFTAWLAVMP